MATTFPLSFSDAGFPNPFVGDNQDYVTNFEEFLAASISSNNLLLGQIGGTMPVSNVGPWLNGTVWYVWSGSTYIPATLELDNSGHKITFSAETLTADRNVQFQDEDGIVAMLSDVYTGRGTTVVTGATPALDWSVNLSFYETTAVSITPTFTNYLPGQRMTFLVVTTAMSMTVTWPTYVLWAGGTPPVQTVAGGADLYSFFNLAGTIYGKVIGQAFA